MTPLKNRAATQCVIIGFARQYDCHKPIATYRSGADYWTAWAFFKWGKEPRAVETSWLFPHNLLTQVVRYLATLRVCGDTAQQGATHLHNHHQWCCDILQCSLYSVAEAMLGLQLKDLGV
jgi:hypothetical protein